MTRGFSCPLKFKPPYLIRGPTPSWYYTQPSPFHHALKQNTNKQKCNHCVKVSHLMLIIIWLPFDKAVLYALYTRYCNDRKHS